MGITYGGHDSDLVDELKGDLQHADELIEELQDFAREVIEMLPEGHVLRAQAEKFFEGRKPESWSQNCLRYIRRDIKNYTEALEHEFKQRYAPPEPAIDDGDVPF
jgi:hypothetical protein